MGSHRRQEQQEGINIPGTDISLPGIPTSIPRTGLNISGKVATGSNPNPNDILLKDRDKQVWFELIP